MKKKLILAGSCLLLAGLLSCSRCSTERTASDLSSVIPADVPAVLLFPDLSTTIGDFDALLKKFSVGPAATFLDQAKLEIKRSLGFDPFDLKGWKSIGVDPKRGLSLVLDPQRPVMVVAVSDPKAFASEMHKRLKELTAADQISRTKISGIEVVTVAAKVGDQSIPQLHYAFVGSVALVAGARANPDLLASLASLKPEQTLAKAKWFTSQAGRVPKNADLLLIFNGPQAEKLLAGQEPELAEAVKEGLALALSVAPSGLSADCFLGLSKEDSGKLAGFTTGVKDSHLEKRLPEDTVLALKLGLNVKTALQTALAMDPDAKSEYEVSFSRLKEMMGEDVEAATVHNLSGNAVVGMSLTSAEKLSQLVASHGEDQQKLGAAFRMFAWVDLKDGQAWSRIIDKAVSTAGDRLPAARSEESPLSVLSIPTEKGIEVHLLHHQNLAGMCVGEGCIQEAARLVRGEGKNLSSRLSAETGKLFEANSLVAGYLDFGRVVDVLGKLDAAALGKGGLAVKMIMDMAIGAIKNLRELTVVVRPETDGVTFRGHLTIQ